MKKALSMILVLCLVFSVFAFTGCAPTVEEPNENQPIRHTVDLTVDNLWKYVDVSITGNGANAGSDVSIFGSIKGVLDFALYENVVIAFDVIYYTPDMTEDEYQSYTMLIALNAAGDAEFETTYLGTTSVTLGKWNGYKGELVNLKNYNRKIYVQSVTGTVSYIL